MNPSGQCQYVYFLRHAEVNRSISEKCEPLFVQKHPLLYWRTGPLPSVKDDKRF